MIVRILIVAAGAAGTASTTVAAVAVVKVTGTAAVDHQNSVHCRGVLAGTEADLIVAELGMMGGYQHQRWLGGERCLIVGLDLDSPGERGRHRVIEGAVAVAFAVARGSTGLEWSSGRSRDIVKVVAEEEVDCSIAAGACAAAEVGKAAVAAAEAAPLVDHTGQRRCYHTVVPVVLLFVSLEGQAQQQCSDRDRHIL